MPSKSQAVGFREGATVDKDGGKQRYFIVDRVQMLLQPHLVGIEIAPRSRGSQHVPVPDLPESAFAGEGKPVRFREFA